MSNYKYNKYKYKYMNYKTQRGGWFNIKTLNHLLRLQSIPNVIHYKTYKSQDRTKIVKSLEEFKSKFNIVKTRIERYFNNNIEDININQHKNRSELQSEVIKYLNIINEISRAILVFYTSYITYIDNINKYNTATTIEPNNSVELTHNNYKTLNKEYITLTEYITKNFNMYIDSANSISSRLDQLFND